MRYWINQPTNNSKDMKSFSFADAYGLGLIARNPHNDWSDIVSHLSDDAQQIALEIIKPGSGPRHAKSAARELLNLAERVRSNDQLH